MLSSAAARKGRKGGCRGENDGDAVEECLLLCRIEEGGKKEEEKGKVGRRKAVMKEGRRTRMRRIGTRMAGGPLELAAGMV